MRTNLIVATTVAALFALSSLPSDAQGQAGLQHPSEGQAAPSGPPATTTVTISKPELREYARARRALEENPNVPMVLRQGETYRMQALDRYLTSIGVMIDAQDYARIDRAVRSNPTLEEQVRSGQITGAGTQTYESRLSDQQLQDYARVRQLLDKEPNAPLVLRQAEDYQTQALDRYLRRVDSMLTANEFMQIQLIVRNDPQVRRRVEAGSPASGAGGAQAPATSASPQ